MAEKRDYYEVLGVSKTATDAEIKKAFRQQAKKYHPDIHPGDKECEEKFKEAQEAYAVLSDPDKRRQYDQFGHAAFDGTGGGAGGFDFSGMDMGDIFGDIFGDFFGGGRSSGRRNGPAQGANVRLSVRISFEEAIFGCTKELEFNYKETCSTCGGNGAKPGTSPETCTQCNGTGKVVRQSQSLFGVVQNVTTCPSCGGSGKVVKDKCPTCHGTGSVTRTQQSIFGMMQTQTVCPQCGGEGKIIKNKCKECGGEGIVYGEEVVTVKIPAGVAEGMQVTMNGKGNAGKHNGVAGDLLVLIEEEKHPELIRDESDLIYNLLLSVPTAALGGTVEIPTIDGKAKIKIEPGTQPGKVLRLRGKGLPNINSYGYSTGTGDLLVNVSVYIPESLTKEERQALEKWQESESFKPDMSLKEKIFKKFRSLFD